MKLVTVFEDHPKCPLEVNESVAEWWSACDRIKAELTAHTRIDNDTLLKAMHVIKPPMPRRQRNYEFSISPFIKSCAYILDHGLAMVDSIPDVPMTNGTFVHYAYRTDKKVIREYIIDWPNNKLSRLDWKNYMMQHGPDGIFQSAYAVYELERTDFVQCLCTDIPPHGLYRVNGLGDLLMFRQNRATIKR